MGRWVLIGGARRPSDRPAIRPDDAGFAFGDGAFETLRAVDGRVVGLRRHLERLARTLAHLGIPNEVVAVLPGRVRRVLASNGLRRGEAVVRVRVSRGAGRDPTCVVGAEALPPLVRARRAGLDVRTLAGEPSPLAGHKTLGGYLPWTLARRASPGQEPMLVDRGGCALECATGNVFAEIDGALWTPPADGRLLPGTARAVVLEIAARRRIAVREAPLPLEALARAFVTNALLRAAPIRRIDGRERATPALVQVLVGDFDEVAGD